MKIAAIGRTKILYDSILKVKGHGHNIVLIITGKESPEYRVRAQDFKLLANKIGVEFIQTEQINSPEVIQIIEETKPDVGISFNWRTIIGQKVIDCFPHGIINGHAGDLPRYRGNAVSNWAIIQGEEKIVLTLHLMTTELDAGPIVLQREMPISNDTYISEVYEFLNNNCPDMFLKAINGFERNSITLAEQPKDPSISLRCYPRTPKDGEIDWNIPAIELERLVRAVSEPFDGAYTFMATEKLIVWRAHYEIPEYSFVGPCGQVAERRPETGKVAVITGEGFLVLEEIETESKGRGIPTEIIKTTRTRLGLDITGEIVRLGQELEKMGKMLKRVK